MRNERNIKRNNPEWKQENSLIGHTISKSFYANALSMLCAVLSLSRVYMNSLESRFFFGVLCIIYYVWQEIGRETVKQAT